MSLEDKQSEVKRQMTTLYPLARRPQERDKVDYNTLYALYVSKELPINEIARILDRTRGRVWQILKEYGLHNKNRKQITSVCAYCHKPFQVVKSRVNQGGGKYCSEDHYYEHKRAVGNFKSNRQGQRIARKNIEQWLGYKLPVPCIVHHEDGDQLNNDPANTFVFPSHSAHLKYHHAKRHGKAHLPYQELNELPNKLKEWFTL